MGNVVHQTTRTHFDAKMSPQSVKDWTLSPVVKELTGEKDRIEIQRARSRELRHGVRLHMIL